MNSATRRKRIALFGATGSIGKSTLDVIRRFPDRFELFAVSCHSNIGALEDIIDEFGPKYAIVTGEGNLKRTDLKVLRGREGLEEVAAHHEADIVLIATLGTIGIFPTLAGLRAGKRIALANKETLVAFGSVVVKELENSRGELIPVDSEHSALFQLLLGWKDDAETLILTASGGPLRKLSREEMERVQLADVRRHPTWNMGKKITVDSATLMNKGLEVVEAHWLFRFPPEKIEVVIHPQSIIHGLLRLRDGALVAHMSTPDMKVPIQYALTYPERLPSEVRSPDLPDLAALTFEPPDFDRFPLLKLAYEAINRRKGYPAVMNAANDVAVRAFLDGKIGFLDIEKIVFAVVNEFRGTDEDLDALIEADLWARKRAGEVVDSLV